MFSWPLELEKSFFMKFWISWTSRLSQIPFIPIYPFKISGSSKFNWLNIMALWWTILTYRIFLASTSLIWQYSIDKESIGSLFYWLWNRVCMHGLLYLNRNRPRTRSIFKWKGRGSRGINEYRPYKQP